MVGGKIEDWKIIQRQEYVEMVDDDSWDIKQANDLFDRLEANDLQLVHFLVTMTRLNSNIAA